MIVSCEITFFVNVCSNMIEMKMFVVNGTILQISPIEWQNQNIFIADKIGGSLSISLETLGGPLRNRSDFNQALSTLNRLHRKSGGQQLRPMSLLELPATAIVIEFFLHLVATEWILVVFIRIQRKSMEEDACKGLRSNGATRCLQIFGENFRRMAFTNLFYFVADRSFTADGSLRRQHLKRPVFAV